MDIREVEAVCAVNTYKSYSEAAFHIASSASVISKQITRLEEHLGIRIFERATKASPVRLTAEGEQIIVNLQQIMNNYLQIQNKLMKMKDCDLKSISIGYIRFLGHFHEMDIISKFVISNPNLVVKYRTGTCFELIDMLKRHAIDLAFLPVMSGSDQINTAYEELASGEYIIDSLFSTSKLCLGMPASHPLASCDIIRREQYPLLHQETFLLTTMQLGNEHKLKRDNLSEVLGSPLDLKVRYVDISEASVVLNLIECGGGILPQACIVPKQMGNVRFVPLEDPGRNITAYLVSRKDASGCVSKLRKVALEFAAELGNTVK